LGRNPVLLGRLYSSPRVEGKKLAIFWFSISAKALACCKAMKAYSRFFNIFAADITLAIFR
jgi:hypothetical protein